MTALAKNRGDVGTALGATARMPIEAGETIYNGAIVCLDADGYVLPGADTAGFIFLGVAQEEMDNASGADGAEDVLVSIGGHLLTCVHAAGSQTQANVGDEATIEDDQTVDVAANTTNDIACGRILKVNSATEVVVMMYPFATQS